MARIRSRAMAAKVTSAEAAAEYIRPGDRVGMSGFTGAGHPKAVPQALSRRVGEANARGDGFAISLWTGGRDRAGARRRAGRRRRPGPAAALPVRPRHAAGDQLRPRRLPRPAPVAHRPDGRAGRPGQSRRRRHRGQRHHRRRRADPVDLASGTTRRGSTRRTGSSSKSTPASPNGCYGMHDIFGRGAAAAPLTHPDHARVRPDRHHDAALPAGQDRRDRRDRSARPGRAVQASRCPVGADRRAPARVPAPRGETTTACRRRCCRCNPAWATSRTPSSPGSTRAASTS